MFSQAGEGPQDARTSLPREALRGQPAGKALPWFLNVLSLSFSISIMGVCNGLNLRSKTLGDIVTAVSEWHVPHCHLLRKSLLARCLVVTGGLTTWTTVVGSGRLLTRRGVRRLQVTHLPVKVSWPEGSHSLGTFQGFTDSALLRRRPSVGVAQLVLP